MRNDMTREEAMLRLVSLNEHEGETLRICAEDAKALQMGIDAIKALDQEPITDVLDKIRAEIKNSRNAENVPYDDDYYSYLHGMDKCLDIIYRYRQEE